jgi:predicted nucleic acid-binding protein
MRLKILKTIGTSKLPQYLLDTSFMIALIDETDFHHQRAKQVFTNIKQEKHEIFLSDVLINETWTVLGKRCEVKQQEKRFLVLLERFQEMIQGMYVLCLYELVSAHYRAHLQCMKFFKGSLSFHDSLIVFFLKEVPQVGLITFDQDFKQINGLKVIS